MSSVALFWNPSSRYGDKWKANTLLYEGQTKMKTMDHYFDQPDTTFYIFKKHYRFGWLFVGQAKANRRIKDRVSDKTRKLYEAPVWEMTFQSTWYMDYFNHEISRKIKEYNNTVNKYLTKEVLFSLLRCEPILKKIDRGIIPFHRNRVY